MPPASQPSINFLAESTMDQEPEWWNEQQESEMTDLDSSFRCPICKDIFESPRIFKTCHHTFCNLCIVRYLTEGKKCPQCRQQASTSDLIPNLVLETICTHFKYAREKMVQILKKDVISTPASSLPTKSTTTLTSKPKTCSSSISSTVNKKRMQTLCYDVLSLKQLKEHLKKLSLPTDGDKPTLVKRHREFVLQYNVNLDKPISDDEIRQRVLENEEYVNPNTTSKKRKEVSTNASSSRKIFEELAQKTRQRSGKIPKHHRNEDVSKASASTSATKKESSQHTPKDDQDDVLIILDSSSGSSNNSSTRSSLASTDVISLDLSDVEEEKKTYAPSRQVEQSQVFENRKENNTIAEVIPQEEPPLFSMIFDSSPPTRSVSRPSSLPQQQSPCLSLELSLEEAEKEVVLSNSLICSNQNTISTAAEIMQLLQVQLSPPIEKTHDTKDKSKEEEILLSPIIFSTYVNSQPHQPQQTTSQSIDS